MKIHRTNTKRGMAAMIPIAVFSTLLTATPSNASIIYTAAATPGSQLSGASDWSTGSDWDSGTAPNDVTEIAERTSGGGDYALKLSENISLGGIDWTSNVLNLFGGADAAPQYEFTFGDGTNPVNLDFAIKYVFNGGSAAEMPYIAKFNIISDTSIRFLGAMLRAQTLNPLSGMGKANIFLAPSQFDADALFLLGNDHTGGTSITGGGVFNKGLIASENNSFGSGPLSINNQIVTLADGTEHSVRGLSFITTTVDDFGQDVNTVMAQETGTWGSTSSTAEHQNDLYFGGTGILTVIPEPSSFALALLGAFSFLLPRRRK